VKDGPKPELMVYNMLSSMELVMNPGKMFGECGMDSLPGFSSTLILLFTF
jgi:hypothetical protein